METSDKSYSVQSIFQIEKELLTKIEDIIKIIGLKNPETYRSKQQAFGPLSSFMEPLLEEGTSVWGLPMPEKYWELLHGNIVAIADKADDVTIGKVAYEGYYFLLTNPAGDLPEKINKSEIVSVCVIEKPNADDPFEVEEVKEYLLGNSIDASKDSLFELITFTAARLYYDEKHPYQAAARVKSEINELIKAVYGNANISQTQLERCLQATEIRLTHRHRVSQIAAVQEASHPDLVELKSFIEKKLAIITSTIEETKKGADQQGEGTEIVTGNEPKSAIRQSQLAMFYFYCHETNSLPPFPAGQIVESYKNVTAPYGLAWKPFQLAYNRFKKRDERLADGNRPAFLAAIEMLKDYPPALKLAQDDLKTAKTRNPLT